MRILMIISALDGGGAERIMSELCSYLVKRAWHVTLMTLEGGREDYFSYNEKVVRVRVDLMWESNGALERVSSLVRRFSLLRRSIKNCDPDIVVSFIDTTNVRVIASSLGLKVPVIVCERTDPRFHDVGFLWKLARRLLYPMAAGVVVQTESVSKWMDRWWPSTTLNVLPNPVRESFDSNVIPSSDIPDSKYILGVGRLSREKGFDLLIDAYSKSMLIGLGWRLVILGDGPDKDSLIAQVRGLGIESNVLFPGRRKDPENWFSRSEIFILSSRYEGFPNVLLEAMQCGTACIAFDCRSGPSEIVKDGYNGVLVTAGDTEKLTDDINQLATNESLRVELKRNAFEALNEFSSERVLFKWEKLFKSRVSS